jgi:hypothetical protein
MILRRLALGLGGSGVLYAHPPMRRIMYVENKGSGLDGDGRIG